MAITVTLLSLEVDPPVPVDIAGSGLLFPRWPFEVFAGVAAAGPGEGPVTVQVFNLETGVLATLEGDFPARLTEEELADPFAQIDWVEAAAQARLTRATLLVPTEDGEGTALQAVIDFTGDTPQARTFLEGWTVDTLLAHGPVVNGVALPGPAPSRDFNGTGADDVIAGTLLDDTLRGRGGDDTLDGSVGDDQVIGAGGADLMRGDLGDDTLSGGLGADTADGGAGNDRILLGGGNDVASGGAGNDTMLGAGGRDDLSGDAGNDSLVGAGGRDTLNGGAGNDQLFGGAAADTFVFVEGDGFTRVMDFSRAQNDAVTFIQSGAAPFGADVDAMVDLFATKVDGHAALRFGAASVIIFVGVDDVADIAGRFDLITL